MKKILIIRLSAIGDIFHTFTVLSDIKNNFPTYQVDWLVDDNFKSIVEMSPLVNKIITLPLKKWKTNKLKLPAKLLEWKKSNCCENYDYIIDTQGLIKTAILAKLFKGPIYGLNYKSAREWLSAFFYNYKYSINTNTLAIVRLRSLVQQIFNYQINENDFNFKLNIDYNFNPINLSEYIIFLHGTSKENKKWSLANWYKLAKHLLMMTNKTIIISYSNEQEKLFAKQLSSEINDIRFIVIKKMSFKNFAEIINNSNLIIGVDTGFTHLANLLKKPVIGIYLNTKTSYVGLHETSKAYNIGGLNKKVEPKQIIELIQTKQLLG